MTLKNLIDFVDGLKPNTFSYAVKTAWVSEVEGMVQTDVLRVAAADAVQYDWDEDQNAELIVGAPHSKLYRYYLEAMIAYEQEEFDRYANFMDMFNRHLAEYVRWAAETLHPEDGTAEFSGYYLSAYALAVKHGYAGTEERWLASLKGEKGDTGETGPQGEKGAPGPQGEKGDAGGVASFNGRTGEIAPKSGDYTAQMVGADSSGAAAAVKSELTAYVDAAIGSAIGGSY